MKAKFPIQKREILIAVLISMLGAIGPLLDSSRCYAQDPNRQLVQPGAASTNPSKRIALVIGNGAYTSAPPLKNPPNDARDMAATLRALGFDVTSGINANQRDMKRLIREFGQKLKTGGSGLFYYAGHGVQSKGRNYLIPVEADIQSEVEAEDAAVDVGLVLGYMDDAQNGLNIVILDACRNNPFARSFRSASTGLAQVDAPTGTLIAYATAPGRVASDGTGQNGLYTSELLKQMRVPGLSATEMFMRVRAEVMKQTANKQVPWEASSLVGSFYFSASKNNGTNSTASESKADPSAFELSYWETIKNSSDPEDFKAYLARYPNGQFAELARRRTSTTTSTRQPSSPAATGTSSAADQYIKSGDELVREDKWAAAEVEYKLAVRLDPTNVEGLNKLGYALHSLRKFSEAESEYRTALRLAPNSAEAHYGVGRALREQKKLALAEAELREAVRLEPGNAKFHGALGLTLGLYLQKFVEGEAEWAQAIRLDPNNAEWHGGLALVLEAQKKHAAAAAEAREAVRLAPSATRFRSYLARLLLVLGNYADAESEARETIRLNPKDAYGHWVLGTSLLNQTKDATEAESALREAVRLEPNEGSFHKNLGVALERLGRKDEADAEYKEALRVAPANQTGEARLTQTFKGSWGIKMAMASSFHQGTLAVSPTKIEFIFDGDQSFQAGQVMPLECSTLIGAVLDNSTIREIAISKNKFRINFGSSSDAASAFAAVREVCKIQR
jgi:uncharacterized caspase-like protein/cytochrome c-type biogenesis protein CcmH/NrfG